MNWKIVSRGDERFWINVDYAVMFMPIKQGTSIRLADGHVVNVDQPATSLLPPEDRSMV